MRTDWPVVLWPSTFNGPSNSDIFGPPHNQEERKRRSALWVNRYWKEGSRRKYLKNLDLFSMRAFNCVVELAIKCFTFFSRDVVPFLNYKSTFLLSHLYYKRHFPACPKTAAPRPSSSSWFFRSSKAVCAHATVDTVVMRMNILFLFRLFHAVFSLFLYWKMNICLYLFLVSTSTESPNYLN